MRLLAFFLLITTTALAERYAILAGVGDYKDPEVRDLEGPPHDVAAIANELQQRFLFDPSKILRLVGRDMTGPAFLKAVDSTIKRVSPGDFVFIYFTGHGTSAHANRGLGLSDQTGAIVPWDTPVDSTNPARVRAKLIIGDRDLRPRLTRLDATGAEVFIVFDACYSGYSAKSLVRSEGTDRYGDFGGSADRVVEDPLKSPDPEEYPYKNIVYMSASSAGERAKDIPRSLLPWKPTLDGLPHGAFTDSLLRGLKGEADTDRDRTVTYEELYYFVRTDVRARFPHTPQLFPRSEANPPPLLSNPIFGTRGTSAHRSPQTANIRIRLEGLSARERLEIQSVPGTQLSELTFDLMVSRLGDQLGILHPNGMLIRAFSDFEELLAALKRICVARELLQRQVTTAFGLHVDTLPANRGVFVKGERIGFVLRSDADCFPLVISVDGEGTVSVLYPAVNLRRGAVANKPLRMPGVGVVAADSYGTEFVRVFGFRDKPAGWDRLAGKKFFPEDELFGEVLESIAAASADARLEILTTESILLR